VDVFTYPQKNVIIYKFGARYKIRSHEQTFATEKLYISAVHRVDIFVAILSSDFCH
jgi:hypothetical protein